MGLMIMYIDGIIYIYILKIGKVYRLILLICRKDNMEGHLI